MINNSFPKRIVSTSKNSAELEDLVIRETKTSRLVFKTTIVNNEKNKKACVKGHFAYKRKKMNGVWEDCESIKLSELKSGEGVKITLSSEEVLRFYDHLSQCQIFYEEHGIPVGEKRILVVDRDIDEFLKVFKKKLNNDEVKMFVDKLGSLDSNDMEQLNYIAGVANLKRLLEIWHSNRENSNEDFWKNLFKNNYWCITNLFTEPVIFFRENAFVGGKTIENKNGKIVDFVHKNKITNYISLVEIKTPKTKLIGREYRSNIYGISSELSGSINQLLSYKDTIQKDYYGLISNSQSKFELINPKCILICGNLKDSLKNEEHKSSFELFRKNLKDIEIITYDELFSKIEILLKTFSGEDDIFDGNHEFKNECNRYEKF